MPLPTGVQTVTVTGLYRHPDGSAFKGRVLFTPEPKTITSALHDVIILGDVEASPDPTTGVITAVLLATDAANCTPTGWTYRVYEQWWHVPARDYPLSLPAAAPTVNLADVAPTDPAAGEYVVITGPQGLQGLKGDKGDKGDPGASGGDVASVNGQIGAVVLNAADVGADPAGSATTAQSAAISTAATDATTKVATHTAASDPHGDRAAASAALSTHVAAADPHGDRAWAAGQFDGTGAAATAQAAAISTAASDATAKVAAHAAASDPHGDRAAAASALATHTAASTAVHGITDTAALVVTTDPRLADARTPTAHASTHAAAGSDPVTPAAIGAYASSDGNTLNGYVTDLQNRVGGTFGLENRTTALESGRLQVALNLSDIANAATARTNLDAGRSIRTASVRITDDNLSGLPSAAAWTVVLTSAGTPLQCSIPAVAGDRIEYYPNFMYAGSHFLDWVLLDSAGAIAVYATTGTSSPGAEGNPALYPSLSFSKETSADVFTVGAGHIDGSGNVTIALAHQGTGSGTVYAHATYPFKERVKNIGPEPA